MFELSVEDGSDAGATRALLATWCFGVYDGTGEAISLGRGTKSFARSGVRRLARSKSQARDDFWGRDDGNPIAAAA